MSNLLNDINIPQINNESDGPYRVDAGNWYKSYPYGFQFFSSKAKDNDSPTETFWLPISPRDINVTTHYATNIITTLYGTIEEHSEVRYYDIVIQGNTGIAPKYATSFKGSNGTQLGGRDFFPSQGGLGGFLPEITNTISAAANLVKAISGGPGSNETGIKPEQSGYYAFHNFYKFLLRYKIDTAPAPVNSGTPSASDISKKATAFAKSTMGSAADSLSENRAVHPLQFLNYKDSVKYDCVPISFTLTRSAENPMLYNYSIRLRAYNLRGVDSKGVSETDPLIRLGLGGLSGSLFSKMTSIAGNASTLLSGIKGLK
jgi:hypothetical protein